MKRLLLVGAAAIPLLLVQPVSADAVIVECANCSTIFQQLQDAATQAKQLATQAMQYKLQMDQYTNQLINTASLPMSVWSQVQSDINQVRNLANAASLLTGNSGSILTRLQSAQGYANQAAFLPENIGQQFTMWQQTLGNASNSLGRTLAVQQQQQIGYAGQQQQIAMQSQQSVGQLQAIQATNETLGLVSTQMNQLQTTMTAAAQQQASRNDVIDDREAAQNAAMLNFFQPGQQFPTTGGVQY